MLGLLEYHARPVKSVNISDTVAAASLARTAIDLVARIDRLATRSGGYRRAGPFLTPGCHRAIQNEPRSPSSHPEAAAPSDELGGLCIALRQRGSLTVWFTEAAIAAWQADLRPDHTGVAVGAFHDSKFPPPTRSVWEESKHEWVALADDIPHFAQGRPT